LLNGIDIAWLVGLIVSGGVYYLLSRSLDLAREESVIRQIDSRDIAAMVRQTAAKER
jgi:nucleobase:cation symporter-1, NCS1 family